jgi:hypothetical protein
LHASPDSVPVQGRVVHRWPSRLACDPTEQTQSRDKLHFDLGLCAAVLRRKFVQTSTSWHFYSQSQIRKLFDKLKWWNFNNTKSHFLWGFIASYSNYYREVYLFVCWTTGMSRDLRCTSRAKRSSARKSVQRSSRERLWVLLEWHISKKEKRTL